MSKEKATGITGATVTGIIVIIYAAIKFSQQAFSFFLSFGAFLFVLSGIVLLIEIYFRDKDYLEFYEYISFWILGGAVIFLILSIPFYVVGYGLGNTQVGLAIQDTGDTIVDAEQQLEETFDKAINDIVEDGCKTLDEVSCDSLRTFSKSVETIEEVTNFANKLKKGADIANKIR